MNKRSSEFIFPLFCGAAACILYELTNAGGLFWGDGGEFMAVSSTLGIGHPYGHPLFWLLGRITIMLNPSNPAGAMNHLVAIFSSATCVVVALIAQRWCDDRFSRLYRNVIVFTVTFIYATSVTVWSQASYVEVYNFQAFFLSLSIYFLDRYFFGDGGIRDIFCSAYFFGISVTLGLYVLFLLILPLLIIIIQKRKIPVKVFIISIIFFTAGLSLWIYLPVRSTVDLTLYFNKIVSINTFVNYLGRKFYSTLDTAGIVAFPLTMSRVLKILFKDLGIWGMIILISFLFSSSRKDKYNGVIIYFLSTILIIFIFGLLIPLNMTFRQMIEINVYFIPVYLLIIPVLTVGAQRIAVILKSHLKLLMILPVFISVFINIKKVALNDHPLAEKFNKYLTSNIPDSSFIVPVSDGVAYSLYYSRYAFRNFRHYKFISAESNDLNESLFREIARRGGMFIEIHEPFLTKIDSLKNFSIAGPFFVSAKDSLTAKRMEIEFVDKFSFDDTDLSRLHVSDRINFAMMWAERGVFWIYRFRNSPPNSNDAKEAFETGISYLYKACRLDDFSFIGAMHAANLALILIQSGITDDVERLARKALKINPFCVNGYRALDLLSRVRSIKSSSLFKK